MEAAICSFIIRSHAICSAVNLSGPGLFLEDPGLEVFVHGLVIGRQGRVDARDPAEEGDKGHKFVYGVPAADLIQPFIGLPDAQRGQGRLLQFQALQEFPDHRIGQVLAPVRLVVEDLEGRDLILVGLKVGLEILHGLARLIPGLPVPPGKLDLIGVDDVDDLLVHLADIFDERIQIAGKGARRLGDELVLGIVQLLLGRCVIGRQLELFLGGRFDPVGIVGMEEVLDHLADGLALSPFPGIVPLPSRS